jgi:hypothetical protein
MLTTLQIRYRGRGQKWNFGPFEIKTICLTENVVKENGFLVYAKKAQEGVEELLQSFLTSGLAGVSVITSIPRPRHSRGKDPKHPLNRRPSGPQRRAGLFEDEKTLFIILTLWTHLYSA